MLSIIIISKNEEKYIGKLLKSIKDQEFKDYEIIVSDAGSTDKTIEIAKKFKCKIVKGGLPSIGRNNGAKNSKGNILLFLDSDVVLPKGFLKENLKEFNEKRLVCATTFYIPITIRKIDKILYHSYNYWAMLMQYSFPYAAGFCIFAKKDVFTKTGGFNEKMLLSEDHEFIKSCIKYGKFRILSSVPILSDVRHFNKDGRIKLMAKYIYAGIYRLFFGDTDKKLFNYELNGGVKI